MPYSNVPEDKWELMDRCVKDVMAQGHGKESAIAICHASIVKGKSSGGDLHKTMWVSLCKSNDEQHIVEGYANSEDPDNEGDLITTQAISKALPDFMKWGAVREMHEPSAVGTVLKAELIDGDVEIEGETYHNPLHIVARIVDRDAWEKVKAGVYKGFSIGGHALKATMTQLGGKLVRKITELSWIELSLADRPVHPGARILLWKAERKGMNMGNVKRIRKAEGDAPQVTSEQAIALLQELRNQVELDGNLDKAGMYTNAIALVLQAEGAEEAIVAEPAEEAEEEHEALGEEPPGLEGETEEKAEASDEEEDEEKKPLELAAGRKLGIRKASWVTPDDLHKAMNSQVKAVAKALDPSLTKLNKAVVDIDARLQRLESQPRSGGPVLRPAEKVIAGQSQKVDAEREEKKSRLSELRKAAAVEPEPLRRTQYMRDILALEAECSTRL